MDTMPFSSCAMAVGLLAPFARFQDNTGGPVALDRVSFEIGIDVEHGQETYTWTDLFLEGKPSCAFPSPSASSEGFGEVLDTIAAMPGMESLGLSEDMAIPGAAALLTPDGLLLECLETWTRTALPRAVLAQHPGLSASIVVKYRIPAEGPLRASSLVVVDDDLHATDDVIATIQAALGVPASVPKPLSGA